jgi:hypothetical protein
MAVSKTCWRVKPTWLKDTIVTVYLNRLR